MDIIDINGHPFSFTWDAYKELIRSYNEDKDNFDYSDYGIYLGFKHGYKLSGKKEITLDEFSELYNNDDFADKAIDAFDKQFPPKKKRWEKIMKIQQ